MFVSTNGLSQQTKRESELWFWFVSSELGSGEGDGDAVGGVCRGGEEGENVPSGTTILGSGLLRATFFLLFEISVRSVSTIG